MKKICKAMLLLAAFNFSIGSVGTNKHKVYADTCQLKSSVDFWNSSYDKITDWVNKDYSKKEEKTYTGKYYKVGVMGHHQKVTYGSVRLVSKVFQNLFDADVVIGTHKSIKENKFSSLSITNQLGFNAETTKGISQMVNASVGFDNEATVGASGGKTVSNKYGVNYIHTETKLSTEELQIEYELNNVCNGKFDNGEKEINLCTYNISIVALYLEVEVKESFTEEQKITKKWEQLKNTKRADYKALYYIGAIQTYTYNSGAYFGSTVIGLFESGVIKEY